MTMAMSGSSFCSSCDQLSRRAERAAQDILLYLYFLSIFEFLYSLGRGWQLLGFLRK